MMSPLAMDPEDVRRVREAMPTIDLVRGYGVVEDDVSPPETTVYVGGDGGGVRFDVDAVRAADLAEWFEDLAEQLAVDSE